MTPLRVAVATSGGRDSTALLHVTARTMAALGGEVHALHVHHGLNAAADDWQAALTRQCRRWARSGLPVQLHGTRLATSPAAGDSVEAWARRERYAALARMAQEAGCGLVLLAHHRRDQAETWLLQALRGGGPQGLSAMPGRAERAGLVWARPWLMQPRQAIEAYVRRHRLSFVDDSSNQDTRFDRNRLRLAVWPPLLAAFPQAEGGLWAAAQRAQEAAAGLRELAQLDAAAAVDHDALRLSVWRLLSPARRVNLLRHWLAGASDGHGVPETLVQRLLADLPTAAQGCWPTPAGALRLYRGLLRVQGAHAGHAGHCGHLAAGAAAGDGQRSLTLDLDQAGDHRLPGHWGCLQVREVRPQRPDPRGGPPDAMALAGVSPSLLRGVRMRARQGGEQFQRAPGTPARALKKQFQDAGVPAWARSGPLLFAADGALLFVPGLGVDARCWAAAGEPRLTLDWQPEPPI